MCPTALGGRAQALAIRSLRLCCPSGRQVSLAALNRTTLRPADDKYDLGPDENLRQVLGRSVWLWPLPHTRPAGDGTKWPQNPLWQGEAAVRRSGARTQE